MMQYTDVSTLPFFLYLRSFQLTRQFKVHSDIDGWMERSLVGTLWNIEYALTLALAPAGLLVAIGDKHNSIGAAKYIETDEEWRGRFDKLCANAKAIFILPGTTNSILWEVNQIYSTKELSDKSFIIMPPNNSGLFKSLLRILFHKSSERYWSRVRNRLKESGVDLPEYSKSGGILALSPTGLAAFQFSIDAIREENIDALLAKNASGIVPRPTLWYDNFFWKRTIFTPGAILAVFISLILAATFRDFVYQPFSIPSGSMRSTLLEGDYLFVSKWAYGYSGFSFGNHSFLGDGRFFAAQPNRGDVVVFKFPTNPSLDYIKRVVGFPGDRIQMKDGQLFINGQGVPREKVGQIDNPDITEVDRPVDVYRETLPDGVSYDTLDLMPNSIGDNTREFVVPAGHYFMMGDNRDNSADSRFSVGFVPAENLVGRADLIFFSIAGGASPLEIWRWPSSVRSNRVFRRVE
jgi:signal peptidase I